MTLGKILGKRIRMRRENREMNRQQLSHAAGVTWANLQMYEEGRKIPDIATVIKLAAGLKTTPATLLKGIEKEL